MLKSFMHCLLIEVQYFPTSLLSLVNIIIIIYTNWKVDFFFELPLAKLRAYVCGIEECLSHDNAVTIMKKILGNLGICMVASKFPQPNINPCSPLPPSPILVNLCLTQPMGDVGRYAIITVLWHLILFVSLMMQYFVHNHMLLYWPNSTLISKTFIVPLSANIH